MRAIFTIDPGESTGVAWGIVNERAETALEAVRDRLFSGSMTVIGEEENQIRQLYRAWSKFKLEAVQRHQMEPDWVDLVVEDFVLFPGEKPGRATTAPERIAWGLVGYRLALADHYRHNGRSLRRHISPVLWQKSGAAHRFANREILTKADAWIVGRDHERSAFAHMILRTNILMDMNVGARRSL
jgi:hypothetical protein